MEVLSTKILERLRREAAETGRPDQRNATLDRLVEACDAIADGTAGSVVAKGNAAAKGSFRGESVPINPPRIENYVIARHAIDVQNGEERSPWTGPVASSLRKEMNGMLAYVRARELERRSRSSGAEKPASEGWWRLVDGIADEAVRLKLIRELSEGAEARKSVTALKAAVRLCSASFDIDAYLRGETQPASQSLPSPSGQLSLDAAQRRSLRQLAKRLTDKGELAGFDLEFDGKRVRQRSTKSPLIRAEEVEVLRLIAAVVAE